MSLIEEIVSEENLSEAIKGVKANKGATHIRILDYQRMLLYIRTYNIYLYWLYQLHLVLLAIEVKE